MTGFLALLRLQLLSRYADLKPRNLKTALKEKRGRTIGTIIGVLFLIVYLGGMLFYVETQILDILMQINMPDLLITLAVMLSSTGTIVMSFFFVLSVLYLGRDAANLATLPLKPRTILSAKMTQVWISETCINALIILPAGLLFGVKTGVAAAFYLRMIVVWLLISLLPICLIAFLSSLLIRISSLWKHREMLVTVSGILLLVVIMLAAGALGGMTGNAAEGGDMLLKFVTSNTGRIETLTKIFPPAGWAAKGMLGKEPGMFGLWIVVSLAAPVLTVWLLGYGYRKLSLLQSEAPTGTRKKFTGRESFAAAGQLKACILREIRTIMRVSSYASNILPVCFLPLIITVMICGIGGMAGGGATNLFAEMFKETNPALVMVILAAFMAYMSDMNPALSTAVTREGKGHDFLIALPVPYMTYIRAKFIVGFGLGMTGLILAAILQIVLYPGYGLQIALACVLCLMLSFANSCLAMSRDIRKPRLDWVTEQEAVKQNFGLFISMLISLGILAALGILSYFLVIQWKLEIMPVFGILAGILAVLGIAAYIRMRKTAEQYYCAG